MSAWTRLLADRDWCRGKGRFPLPAYSEYLPPPYVGMKPSGDPCGLPDVRADDYGWNIDEYAESLGLRPGLERIARAALDECRRLAAGQPLRHFSRAALRGNAAWPAALAAYAGRLAHERFTVLLPCALSRTQDDKGRVRWTLFGSSEQGPARPFWRGFFTGPREEAPWGVAEAFFAELLSRCYGVPERQARDPAAAGLRHLPLGSDPDFPFWSEGKLPSWAEPLRYRGLDGVRFLLTFRPFERLPAEVQDAYVAGRLHLIPFPGSLLFWHFPEVRRLQKRLPFAMQIPLLRLYERTRGLGTLRVPQSGWFHESAAPGEEAAGAHRERVARPHRWQKVRRHENDLNAALDAPLARALFSTDADLLGLYDKPLARQAQVWTAGHRLVLDGSRPGKARVERAEEAVLAGGRFGYRFVYPAMRVGPHEVYWHRPVAAFAGASGPEMLAHSPTGYLTAYRAGDPDLARPVELWPRFLARPGHLKAAELGRHEPARGTAMHNVRAVLEWSEMLGRPLPHSLARALIDVPERQTVARWLDGADWLRDYVEAAPDAEPAAEEGLTFGQSATRAFEEGYWRTIAALAHGRFRNKCVGDVVRDGPTRAALSANRRGLDAVRRHLTRAHAAAVAGTPGAWVAEQRFAWKTEFEYPWMGGWRRNQSDPTPEANVIVRIPGRDPSRAVILADHYDTAYMHDRYLVAEGGTGARLAADGADDNGSATALLLLAAPILLGLSRAGRLGCDVWLVHLTGEEFPADCLGARMLTQALVQRTLRVKPPEGRWIDLSGVAVDGVFVCDMIAHDTPARRKVFQIAPGENAPSAELAAVALEATRAWNALAQARNRVGERCTAGPFRRSTDPVVVPALAPFAVLRPEVRPDWDPRSTLFNTDAQIFSDAGFPTVLFMEDYDIDREGYHDTKDTVALIDLDYGAALAAVALETAARVAVASGG